MNTTIKTLAIAGLMGTLSAPAFAAAHMDINSMTCEEYNQLGGADRDKVALMAVADLNTNAEGGSANAKAVVDDGTSSATESTDSESLEGSATATSIEGAGDDMTRMGEEIARFNRICSRNWDAMVTEAAAGLIGTR